MKAVNALKVSHNTLRKWEDRGYVKATRSPYGWRTFDLLAPPLESAPQHVKKCLRAYRESLERSDPAASSVGAGLGECLTGPGPKSPSSLPPPSLDCAKSATSTFKAGSPPEWATFGQRLAHLRVRKLLSQEALASAVGVSTDTIRKAEQGRSHPSFEVLARVEKILGGGVGFYMGERPPASRVWAAATRRKRGLNT